MTFISNNIWVEGTLTANTISATSIIATTINGGSGGGGETFTGGTVSGATEFTNGVTSTTFIKSGGSPTEYLLANGSVDSGLTMTNDYILLTTFRNFYNY